MRYLPLLLVLGASSTGAANVAFLRDVRPILEPDHTRLIFDTGRPVRYRLQVRPRDEATGTPARLYVDFYATRVSATPPILVPREGPLTRLRATQLKRDVTRVILDVPGLTEHTVFPLLDPFRLVVDVRGKARPPSRGRAVARTSRLAVAAPAPSQVRLPASTVAAVRASLQRGTAEVPRHRRTRFRVVLDPGHGGKDPGAVGAGGVLEKDVVLDIARRLAERLEAAGYDVIMTRDSDVFVPLPERTQRANAAQADLFVSIHANASPNRAASGIETYYLSNTNDRATIRLAHMENQLLHMTGEPPADSDVSWIVSDMIQSYKVEESHGLARQIQASLVAEARRGRRHVRDLGSKPGPFFVLVGAAMPAVLAEVAFVSHPEEARRLRDDAYRKRLVEGLLLGIGRFVENATIAATL